MAENNKKEEFERLAVQWVERLLEPFVAFDILVEAMQYIEPRHYMDVVEERYIIKFCGWAQCGNQLTDIPKAKFHVSVRHKQVIDITERKKFCSSKCFSASKHYMSLLSTQPVWLRTKSHVHNAPSTDTNDSCDTTVENELTSTKTCISEPQTKQDTCGSDNNYSITKKKLVSLNITDDDDSDDEWLVVEELHKQQKIQESVKDKLFQSLTVWTVPKVLSTERSADETAVNNNNDIVPLFIPPVHSIAPSQVQCNIFISQIRTNLREIAGLLDLTVHEVLPQLSQLVKSFQLTKDTIVFQPFEWKILICVMITSLQLADLTDHQLIHEWLENIHLTKGDFQEFVKHFRERLKFISCSAT